MFCQIAIINHRKGGTLADRYIMKWCTAVQSHWDGGFTYLFEINMKSETQALLRVLKSVGSGVFLGLDVFFPCIALLQFRWHMVFPLSPPVDLQVVARPPSGSQSRYAGASCKET